MRTAIFSVSPSLPPFKIPDAGSSSVGRWDDAAGKQWSLQSSQGREEGGRGEEEREGGKVNPAGGKWADMAAKRKNGKMAFGPCEGGGREGHGLTLTFTERGP